jgi:hypothetical protein
MNNNLSTSRLKLRCWRYLVRKPEYVSMCVFGVRQRSFTISAASVPAIENSRSAYFFQYPKSRGNLARNRSYASRVVAIACGLELRFRPPSRVSAARTSFSQFSKLSVSSSYLAALSAYEKQRAGSEVRCTNNFSIELFDLRRLFVCTSVVERHFEMSADAKLLLAVLY